jgi:hypothetical protein
MRRVVKRQYEWFLLLCQFSSYLVPAINTLADFLEADGKHFYLGAIDQRETSFRRRTVGDDDTSSKYLVAL